MNREPTQPERVLRYIEEHGSINQGITLKWDDPITRLAARIADLKEAGHNVGSIGKDGKFERYGFLSPLREDAKPQPPKARCPKCDITLENVKPTIAPKVVTGICPRHKVVQTVVR